MAHRDPSLTLVGYILADKEDNRAEDDSETDEVEEDKQPEFLDMQELHSVSCGACMCQSSVPAMVEVGFMTSRQKCRVQGRFALRDPWWEVSCAGRRLDCKFVVKGYPSYRLRTHLKEDRRAVVSLFLAACEVDAHLVTQFIEWLPENREVDPTNIEETLKDFGNDHEQNKGAVDYAISKLSTSVAGFYVQAARMYPHIMKYMPTLVPGQFLNLLNRGKEEENPKTTEASQTTDMPAENKECISILAKLEKLLKTAVWKLGFNYIMWKEFKLVRCEAKVEAFMDCRLFSNIPPLQQNALLVYDDLKTYCRKNGHTYIDREVLQTRMRNCKWIKKKIPEESTWEAVDFLRKEGVLKVERQKIALRNLFKYETEIADCLSKLVMGEQWKINLDVKEVLCSAHRIRMKSKAGTDAGLSATAQREEECGAVVSHEHTQFSGSIPNLNDFIDEDPDLSPVELDPDQVRAAEMICVNPVTVISGKGGCGKTTVVSLVFKAAMEQQEKNKEADISCKESKKNKEPSLEVLLTAPTGRAASLLTKKTSFTAYTMHQVLWSFMTTEKNPSGEPMNWKFANIRVLVVDEGSLVCVQILHSLLTMLTKHANLQKFVMLGDVRQLPSIEPGNALNDLFKSFQRLSWAIEMRTNHRAESEVIVHNAGLIAEMGLKKTFYSLDFDAVVDMSEQLATLSSDKKFIHIVLPEEGRVDDLQTSIKQLLKGPAPGLNYDRSSQFVAFMRRDCALINELCCKHYSGHVTKTSKNKINFQTKDKVCCTKNGYVTDIDKGKEILSSCDKENAEGNKIKVPKNRLCNGEIYFIEEDVTNEEAGKRGSRRRTLKLCNEFDQKALIADYRELQRECKLRHAWARTIHTFQGSEEKTIVYVLGNGISQNWKHFYTAVTRGQQRVYVIAKNSDLKKVIPGQVINRHTRLGGLISDLIGRLRAEREDLFIQPSQSQSATSKLGSSFQWFQSPEKSLTNTGLNQASSPGRYCARAQFNCSPGQNQHNFSPSRSPSVCKRQSSTDNCNSPAKQLKTAAEESPLGSSRLEMLSLDGRAPKPHARQLFTSAPQSPQHKKSQ